jgi:hydrogenase-1 operon protein HyaF
MSKLEHIKVVEQPPEQNLGPLLHEIGHALDALASRGEEHVIDLQAMPFGPGDEEALMGFLGQGEANAHIDALGESRIVESRFPGVWLVDHYNEDGERIALQIEITRMPSLLRTPQEALGGSMEDFRDALRQRQNPQQEVV